MCILYIGEYRVKRKSFGGGQKDFTTEARKSRDTGRRFLQPESRIPCWLTWFRTQSILNAMEVNIHQAKTHLSKLLRRTIEGEEIIIARAGVPIAKLISIERGKAPRPLDLDRGLFEVPEDFDAPLPPEVIAAFEGKGLRKRRKTKTGGRHCRA